MKESSCYFFRCARWRASFSSARARNAEILFWIGGNFRLSAILSGFSEVTATEPLLLRKNREDIEYGTEELRNEPHAEMVSRARRRDAEERKLRKKRIVPG
jgi:hypothetical protein